MRLVLTSWHIDIRKINLETIFLSLTGKTTKRQMIKLVKKDLKLFFSNRQDMMLTFVLPIIFITLFAFVFGKMNNSKEGNLVGLVHSVAGTSVMMLLFSVAGIGGSLLDEKQEGMLKKLLCSPIPPNYILFGKMVFANIISIIQL
jgi:ABC-type transport system involved in cytochrome c biogenesis permease component